MEKHDREILRHLVLGAGEPLRSRRVREVRAAAKKRRR